MEQVYRPFTAAQARPAASVSKYRDLVMGVTCLAKTFAGIEPGIGLERPRPESGLSQANTVRCFSEFSSEFFVFASRFLEILPKIRKFRLSLREACSDSREFDT